MMRMMMEPKISFDAPSVASPRPSAEVSSLETDVTLGVTLTSGIWDFDISEQTVYQIRRRACSNHI
jgi:hypothetical protein